MSRGPSSTATLIIGDSNISLPILANGGREQIVDITGLQGNQILTYDLGYSSTASARSAITYVDGEKGILRYRGYDVAELAEKSTFLEVSYLLLEGELLDDKKLSEFAEKVAQETVVPQEIEQLYRAFPKNSHPMAMLISAMGCLANYYPELNLQDSEQRRNIAIALIAKMPTLAAMAYNINARGIYIAPNPNLSYTENFLTMLLGQWKGPEKLRATANRVLDLLFILHADHEQNASTSTVRMVGSTGVHPMAAVGAGIAALWGPLHGGANEAVLKMLAEALTLNSVADFIREVKDRKRKLMGFGHRVYKSYDPRAKIIREACLEILKDLGQEKDPLLNIAMELEEAALRDEYFIERKLYPNVDFYSGIIYRALKIPTAMFTAMFAIARTAGWIAQWHEMLSEGELKINRPRQIYIGEEQRSYPK